MKIAIFSDSHDNVPNLEKALEWLKSQDVKVIIHCGDLCNPATLSNVIVPNFSGQIHLIHGNVSDRKSLEKVALEIENVKLHGDFGELVLDQKKIAFVHKPEEARQLAETGKYDLVFYGHSHKPWVEQLQIKVDQTADKHGEISARQRNLSKSVLLVNPGTLAGLFYKATFALYDTKTDKLELKILERLT
jgi:putative phosphoesterase